MAQDAQEYAVTCIEKCSNYEASSKMLQDYLSKKYGNGWHVVMGEGFGMEVRRPHCYSFSDF